MLGSRFDPAGDHQRTRGPPFRFNRAEERIAGGLDRIGRELRRLETAQQAEFALIDALARALFLCIPEPVAVVRSEALARAKQRHQKLLKMAALSMRGDVQAALSNLANHE